MSRRTDSLNAYEVGLTSGISDVDTSFPVESTVGLIAPGYLVINPDDPTKREYFKYTIINGSNLEMPNTGFRGLRGSASGASAHLAGARVRAVAVGQWLDDIFSDIEDLEAAQAAFLLLDGTRAMTGDLNMGGKLVQNMTLAPTLDGDATSKAYVDQEVGTSIPLAGTNAPTTVIPLDGKLEWGDATNRILFDASGNFILLRDSVLRIGITDTDTFLRSPDNTKNLDLSDTEAALDVPLLLPLTNTVAWGALVDEHSIRFDGSGAFTVTRAGDVRMAITATETFLRSPDTSATFTIDDEKLEFRKPVLISLNNPIYWGSFGGGGSINYDLAGAFTLVQNSGARFAVTSTETWLRDPSGLQAITIENPQTTFASPRVLFPNGVLASPGIAFASQVNRGIMSAGATMDFVVDGVQMISMANVWVRIPSVWSVVGGPTANVVVDSSGQMKRTSSARRYKTNIAYAPELADLELKPATFHHTGDDEDHIGFIAEDLAEQDPRLATYNEDGEIQHFDVHAAVAVLAAKVARLEANT